MGKKASERRKEYRQAYLRRLAKENPERFLHEWNKRLDSWSREAKRRSEYLRDRDGNPVPNAFGVVRAALDELCCCGKEAVELEYAATGADMTDVVCRAVANAFDFRIYRLSNARANQRSVNAGTHKPTK